MKESNPARLTVSPATQAGRCLRGRRRDRAPDAFDLPDGLLDTIVNLGVGERTEWMRDDDRSDSRHAERIALG